MPHIFAADEAGLFKAYGYAQAKSHGNLILKLYGQARGRVNAKIQINGIGEASITVTQQHHHTG